MLNIISGIRKAKSGVTLFSEKAILALLASLSIIKNNLILYITSLFKDLSQWSIKRYVNT